MDPIIIKQENFNSNVVRILNENIKNDSLLATEVDSLQNSSNEIEKQTREIISECKKEIEELRKILNEQVTECKKEIENLFSQLNTYLSSRLMKR